MKFEIRYTNMVPEPRVCPMREPDEPLRAEVDADSPVLAEEAIRELGGVVVSVREIKEQETFGQEECLVSCLGCQHLETCAPL